MEFGNVNDRSIEGHVQRSLESRLSVRNFSFPTGKREIRKLLPVRSWHSSTLVTKRANQNTLGTTFAASHPCDITLGDLVTKSAFSKWLLSDLQLPKGVHSKSEPEHPWWRVMCLTGVDYFSTLGYQPGNAFCCVATL
jgi:hypothetical protein